MRLHRGGVRAARRRATCVLLRNAEGFRFAHPGALALIPLARRARAVGGLRRGPRAARRAHLLARRRAGGAARAAWWRACATCRWCCAWPSVVLVGVALARPQTHARRRRPRAGGHRHRDRARRLGLDAGDGSAAQPPRRRQDGDRGLRAAAADRSHRRWSCSGARPTRSAAHAGPRHVPAHAGRAAPRHHRRARHGHRQRHRRRAQPAAPSDARVAR